MATALVASPTATIVTAPITAFMNIEPPAPMRIAFFPPMRSVRGPLMMKLMPYVAVPAAKMVAKSPLVIIGSPPDKRSPKAFWLTVRL